MKLKQDQIDACRKDYKGDDFTGYVTFLESIGSIRYNIIDAYEQADIDHRNRIKQLDEYEHQNQENCPHPRYAVEHVADHPWRSYYQCNLCGKNGVKPQ